MTEARFGAGGGLEQACSMQVPHIHARASSYLKVVACKYESLQPCMCLARCWGRVVGYVAGVPLACCAFVPLCFCCINTCPPPSAAGQDAMGTKIRMCMYREAPGRRRLKSFLPYTPLCLCLTPAPRDAMCVLPARARAFRRCHAKTVFPCDITMIALEPASPCHAQLGTKPRANTLFHWRGTAHSILNTMDPCSSLLRCAPTHISSTRP